MKIRDWLGRLAYTLVQGSLDEDVEDVVYDSRKARPHTVFVCIRGSARDSHTFIPDVLEKGCRVLVTEKDVTVPGDVTVLRVENGRLALAELSAARFGYPAEKLVTIGITGTKGKTTTSYMVKAILEAAGKKVGLIGTINVMIGDEVRPSHNTTPDVVDLQKMLYEMVENHCDTCVMEVSSHALALDRVAGIEYDTAVLTNITQDHLDFHKTMENYREAKALLFTRLHEGTKPNKTAVFNTDDPSSAIIMPRVKTKIMTYGKGKDNDVYPLTFHVAASHMELNLQTPVGEMDLKLHITGEFNVYNVMGSICAAIAEGLTREDIIRGLDDFAGVPGRFQLIHAGQPFTVVVDYAHTPDGLENVLKTARQITKGKLWVVFGAGGDRDRKKRPIMGKIALDLADIAVVTSDNPRTEDPEAIIRDIEEGLKDNPEGKEIHKITDRREAIEYVMAHAKPDDVVMIAGKGHENYQILKDRTIHFDDGEVVRDFFQKGKTNA